MQNIKIERLENIKKELESLEEDDVLFVDDDNKTAYAIMPIAYFDKLDVYRELQESDGPLCNAQVKIMRANGVVDELSFDDYEKIRSQLLEIFDKSFKPKSDKLN